MFKLSKNKKRELVLEINVPKWSLKTILKGAVSNLMFIFNPIFSFFDSLAERRKLVISGVGLGIGLGLSIIITQRPDLLQAFSVGEQGNNLVTVSEVSIPSIQFYSTVTLLDDERLVSSMFRPQLFELSKFGSLSSATPTVITTLNPLVDIPLDQVFIGDEVVVTGSNQGQYSFRVVEIKELEAEYLPQVVSRYSKALILYTPLNVLRTKILLIVALLN